MKLFDQCIFNAHPVGDGGNGSHCSRSDAWRIFTTIAMTYDNFYSAGRMKTFLWPLICLIIHNIADQFQRSPWINRSFLFECFQQVLWGWPWEKLTKFHTDSAYCHKTWIHELNIRGKSHQIIEIEHRTCYIHGLCSMSVFYVYYLHGVRFVFYLYFWMWLRWEETGDGSG